MKETKKILVILGHPGKKSLCRELADTYEKTAKKAGAEVRRVNIRDLKFDPILWEGYAKIQKLEPDLVKAQEQIRWAEHIVIVYPVWWSSTPAIFKGFIDRVFLPSFAFKYQENGFPKPLLPGKTGHLIVTMGVLPLFHRLIGEPAIRQISFGTLRFCGIKPVRITRIGPVNPSRKDTAAKAIERVKNLAERLK